MDRLPISVCMIAGAEAHRIGRALASVASWTRELIVVVNQEVSDGTDAVAAQFGATVFREPWKGHIAQKNSAAAKASQPWLFGLDADEEVSAPLQAEIAQALAAEAQAPRYAAFSMPRCTWFAGRWIRHGDWYPDRKVRLWRQGHGHWAGTDPHDRLQVSGRIGRLRHDLLHYSMESVDHLIRKALVYGDVFAREALKQGRRASLVDLWGRPLWRLVRGYLLRGGFLDGWQGWCVAWLDAFSTFVRYAKLRQASSQAAPNP